MASVAVRNWRTLLNVGNPGCRWFEGVPIRYLSVRRILLTIGGDGRGIDFDTLTVLTIKVLHSEPGSRSPSRGSRGAHGCSGRR